MGVSGWQAGLPVPSLQLHVQDSSSVEANMGIVGVRCSGYMVGGVVSLKLGIKWDSIRGVAHLFPGCPH